jgi:hypothetical protein
MEILASFYGLLLVLVSHSVAPSQALAAAPPALTEQSAATIVQKSRAFTGANSGRQFGRIRALKRFEEAAPQVEWLAEFEWTEAGKTRSAVAAITRATAPHEQPFFLELSGWAIVGVLEDTSLDRVVGQLQGVRLQANEAATKAEMRTIAVAQITYQATSGGAFAELRCLADPKSCIPGTKEAPFIDKNLASLADTSGYRRKFYPGPKAKSTGLSTWAYTAVPVTPGQTGVRGFCIDDRQDICFTADGKEPAVVNGRCASTCEKLK